MIFAVPFYFKKIVVAMIFDKTGIYKI